MRIFAGFLRMGASSNDGVVVFLRLLSSNRSWVVEIDEFAVFRMLSS